MEKLALILLLVLTGSLVANLAFGLISGDNIISNEQPSPSDNVSDSQIQVYQDKVILNVKDTYWAEYSDSNSMDPVLDARANGIEIIPKIESELKVGDIVSYTPAGSESLIVHRIVSINSDAEGTFYTMKGDNNSGNDPEKVRFSQIKFKTIAIIY